MSTRNPISRFLRWCAWAMVLAIGGCATAEAADQLVTLRITITNPPPAGATIIVNSDTRTWTNSVGNPATQVLTSTNGVGGNATNLYAHVALYGFTGPLVLGFSSSNQVTLRGQINQAMSATASAGWASITYTTNTVTTMVPVRVPASGESVAIRRYAADQLVQTIVDNASTNQFPATAKALTNFINRTQAQSVSAALDFTNPSNRIQGQLTNNLLRRVRVEYDIVGSAIQFHDQNGDQVVDLRADVQGYPSLFYTYPDPDGTNAPVFDPQPHHILTYSTATNKLGSKSLPNTWTAPQSFSSPISIGGGGSISGVVTGGHFLGGTFSGAISNLQGGAISNTTLAGVKVDHNVPEGGLHFRDQNDDRVTSIRADAYGVPSLYDTYASPTGTGAYGGDPAAANLLSWRTATNRFGAKALPNTWTAAQTLASQLILSPTLVSSLANGANAGVNFGDYTLVKLTVGPTGAFSIAGIAGGVSGRILIIHNATSQNLTWSHESGVEPTAANRITTLTGADVATTGAGAAILYYDTASTRWILLVSTP